MILMIRSLDHRDHRRNPDNPFLTNSFSVQWVPPPSLRAIGLISRGRDTLVLSVSIELNLILGLVVEYLIKAIKVIIYKKF